ncbi:dephospho-CoA kinase [Muribaculum sp. NM65_B17]|jgi:dephospho-coA kinase|uniref:dephospho-CoA kinase n=5 Tax=Muribaculum TaxID=1918540 RepID=UPI000F4986FA|nr:dephospho-CoA kinase [Muribaculum sp. NM65_B17]ROT12979.1 dephospho-CoA kinase [Muribaculaceae bacterium Isolate-102 (HZI)]TGY05722.1 dephospho-CoA kinase [Muribaculum sp. NM65_B17]THG43758.1 dephospho-CoA kinase [Muribaculaceae bacterium]
MSSTRLIAITGGIGSGKSIISDILRAMGHKVYDCDTRAKALMDTDESIKNDLIDLISIDAVRNDRTIDRKLLSEIVFNDPDALSRLNSIVHKAVRADLRRWRDTSSDKTVWVETAILYASRLDREVDEVWEVTAPTELRVQRVMKRNSMSREQVLARISSQSTTAAQLHPLTKAIVNDGVEPVLPQILSLL